MRAAALALLASLASGCASSPGRTSDAAEVCRAVVLEEPVVIRTTPAHSAPVVASLPAGSGLYLCGLGERGWTEVRYPNTIANDRRYDCLTHAPFDACPTGWIERAPRALTAD